MGNVAMHDAIGRAFRGHALIAATMAGGRPYWECLCGSSRHLAAPRDGETEASALSRTRLSHARHQAKELGTRGFRGEVSS